MTKLKSRFVRLFTALALVASILVGTGASTVFAAETSTEVNSDQSSRKIGGEEVWYNTDTSDTFTVTNDNLTKVKTMGKSGTLHIALGFTPRPDLDPYPGQCPPIKVTVQIRSTSGQVLASQTVSEDAFMRVVNVSTNVTAGQKVQIYMDVSSTYYNPYRNFRSADMYYMYEIY